MENKKTESESFQTAQNLCGKQDNFDEYFHSLAKTAGDFVSEYNDYLLYSVGEDIIKSYLATHKIDKDSLQSFYKCMILSFSKSTNETKLCVFCPHANNHTPSFSPVSNQDILKYTDVMDKIISDMKNSQNLLDNYNADVLSDLRILVEDSLS